MMKIPDKQYPKFSPMKPIDDHLGGRGPVDQHSHATGTHVGNAAGSTLDYD